MRRVIAFDVNETLLDLGALDPQFVRVFGDAAARREWFNQVIELAITATASNVYFDFGVVGDAALTMVAARRNVELSPTARVGILRGMRALRAGCAAGFVSRPGKVLDPLAPRPDVVGPDLEAVAAGIIAVEAEQGG